MNRMNIRKSLMILICACLFYATAFPQNSTVSVDSGTLNKPNKKHFNPSRKIENVTEWSSSYEFDNKLPAIEGSNVRNETFISLRAGKYDMKFLFGAITPTKRDPDEMIGRIGIGIRRDFHSFGIAVTNDFNFMHRRKFGVLKAEADKTWHLAEEVGVKAFTNVSYFYGLESTNNDVSNNVVWNNGAEFEAKLGKGYLGIKPMLIADNGALHKGRRLAVNIETEYLFGFRRIRVGPKFGFTTFTYASHESHLEKRNHKNFGIIFKVM